jgi:hypothetical protein
MKINKKLIIKVLLFIIIASPVFMLISNYGFFQNNFLIHSYSLLQEVVYILIYVFHIATFILICIIKYDEIKFTNIIIKTFLAISEIALFFISLVLFYFW